MCQDDEVPDVWFVSFRKSSSSNVLFPIVRVNSVGCFSFPGSHVISLHPCRALNAKSEALSAINIGLVILPVIAFLSLISIGKNFAKQKKYQIDSTQGNRSSKSSNCGMSYEIIEYLWSEMIALGITNLTNSFVFGVAANTAAMSRSGLGLERLL